MARKIPSTDQEKGQAALQEFLAESGVMDRLGRAYNYGQNRWQYLGGPLTPAPLQGIPRIFGPNLGRILPDFVDDLMARYRQMHSFPDRKTS